MLIHNRYRIGPTKNVRGRLKHLMFLLKSQYNLWVAICDSSDRYAIHKTSKPYEQGPYSAYHNCEEIVKFQGKN